MFHINAQSDVPVYRQLVDEIRSAIRAGRLAAGAQLPTVLAMAEDLGLARGTIKRAYDELELLGLVEKVQGRGTFVCYRPPSAGSRKEQAMDLIDRMLDGMGELGFSTEEIGIFLELKLRERAVNAPDVRVAVIESSSENLSQMARQLRQLEGVEICSYLLSSVEAYPYNLDEEADLIVTTGGHACQLKNLLPQSDKIARVALRLSLSAMAEIVRLQPGERVGVLGCSQRFGDLLFEACAAFAGDAADARRGVPGAGPARLFGGKGRCFGAGGPGKIPGAGRRGADAPLCPQGKAHPLRLRNRRGLLPLFAGKNRALARAKIIHRPRLPRFAGGAAFLAKWEKGERFPSFLLTIDIVQCNI